VLRRGGSESDGRFLGGSGTAAKGRQHNRVVTCDPIVGFLFALVVIYFVFFLNRFLLFITKFLVELGVDLSFLEAKRHSEQD